MLAFAARLSRLWEAHTEAEQEEVERKLAARSQLPHHGKAVRTPSDHALGALLGLAVGDALGTTYEFAVLEQPAYPELATGPAIDIVGGGPFQLAPGAITDDTQMAVCLARSLLAYPDLNLADVAARYRAWSTEAFDIGTQTRAAIDRIAAGESPRTAGHTVWLMSGRSTAGNGSLMRAAPLAVAYAGRPGLIEAAIAESFITHADPRCALACVGFVAAIAAALRSPGATGIGMLAAARAGITQAIASEAWTGGADRIALRTAAAALITDLDAALSPDPGVYTAGALHIHQTAGFVRVAFRLALWHLIHTPSWQAAVIDVASRGGDADTNAAITGALLGARDSADAIPSTWIARVLAAKQRGSDAWGRDHHPNHLIALVNGA